MQPSQSKERRRMAAGVMGRRSRAAAPTPPRCCPRLSAPSLTQSCRLELASRRRTCSSCSSRRATSRLSSRSSRSVSWYSSARSWRRSSRRQWCAYLPDCCCAAAACLPAPPPPPPACSAVQAGRPRLLLPPKCGRAAGGRTAAAWPPGCCWIYVCTADVGCVGGEGGSRLVGWQGQRVMVVRAC